MFAKVPQLAPDVYTIRALVGGELWATHPLNIIRPVIKNIKKPVTLVISAEADAEVRQYYPTINYGTNPVMFVAPWGEWLDSRKHRAFVKFSLALLPANAVVRSATLNLYHREFYGIGMGTYGAYRVTAIWDELAITWNNQPPFALSPTDDISADISETRVWRSWDVTPDIDDEARVKGWVSWVIRYIPEDARVYRTLGFASKEGGRAPYLEITYIP